jgi:hypothetical protein
MSSERPIPSSRAARLSHLGRLAGGIAGGLLSEGAKQLVLGQRPLIGDLLSARLRAELDVRKIISAV